jgi:glycosyltransferase involved in cell wall biosynthesis
MHTDSKRSESVLICNLSAPEINRLGVELAGRGLLHRYVRPYANMQRGWERAVSRIPGMGAVYKRTLGRRLPPPGLPPDKVIQAGVAEDFASAVIGRVPFAQDWGRRKALELTFAAERAVAKKGGKLARDASIVVASYGTARYAFESVHRSGGRAVLNYPIAHNRYQARFYAEEAEYAPEFAAALPRMEWLPEEYSDRLEQECATADRIMVGSSFARQSFVELGYDASRIVVTPYGVDAQQFTPAAQPRRDGVFRVLFVGQIGQRKGLSYLFQGYEMFRRPDSELHVVGGYSPGHEVYARYEGLYRHTAHVPHKDLPSLFREADVFVFPSLIEGLGLVVLEAMACGVPIITTTRGPGDVVRDGIDGFFVPIRDPESIANRLDQLYRDPSLREQLGRNAREQALRHSWQAYAERAADAVLSTPERGVAFDARAGHSAMTA